ncbi:MAG: 50S ribosomal protein L3 [Patescibacteria group bacterium]
MKFIIGKKVGMTQMFDEKGNITPLTLIEAGPCEVLQLKNMEKDGYEATQIGFQKIEKAKRIKKPQTSKPFKFMKEFKGENLKVGDKIDVSVFKEGDKVKISGISKGKGFQGPMKRHGFHGRASVSHGTKHELRTPGSTGSSMPEHVAKGKKMAGHMGAERVSVKGLKIMKIDLENNLIAIKGAVPGRRGTLLEIKG